MATFLVTGATGFIGSRFAELALEKGHRVRTITRADWGASPAIPPADRYLGVLPHQIPHEAMDGVDIIVHCAADTKADEGSSFAVNVTGTVNLAREALATETARTFIFISSQSAQPEATSAYGRSKYAAERALLNLKGLDVVILRPGLVCGPASRGLFQRMCNLVQKLPVIPLLGGGRAIVQPVHVDDLCAAIFECATRPKELAGSILNLGDPDGIALADFLQLIAKKVLGRKKTTLHIPLWPIEMVVGTAERLGVSLPINTNNLKGLKVVARMETRSDLNKLRIHLRPVEATIDAGAVPATVDPRLDWRAVRIILIGGGRIGLVHALTLWRSRGVYLGGLIDTKRSALNLLKGMGLPVPTFDSLQGALRATQPDAAVIATPTATHFPLARTCLSERLRVLVEKPLCVRREQLEDFRKLDNEFPNSIFVGYVMPRNPQVESLIERLKAGTFGQVKSFLGLTLHAHILHSDPTRWEVQKKISGGGVLINSGGHLLSMIHAAFGIPQKIEAQSLHIHSTEVEDSLVATFYYPGFQGQQFASWSVNGFQRQENRLVIWTEQGTLILTASAGVFVSSHGSSEICHQLDFNVGFNLAPDYAGAGFTKEMQDLASSVRTGKSAPMNVRTAIEIEEMLFKTYEESKTVSSFGRDLSFPTHATKAVESQSNANQIKRFLDLREVSTGIIARFLKNPSGWDGYEITSDNVNQTQSLNVSFDSLRVTVPNFLLQSRLLMAGRYAEVVKRMGAGGAVRAGITALPMIARARGVTFWAAAMALLAGDLARVPTKFNGTLLLHSYLADLALALRQTQILQKMLRLCRYLRPQARIGFHTNLASEADAALPFMNVGIDEISVLTSPSGYHLTEIIKSLSGHAKGSLTVTAEVGPGPAILHQTAASAPERWTHGGSTILLGPMADGVLAEMVSAEKAQAWRDAFPDVEMPEAAL